MNAHSEGSGLTPRRGGELQVLVIARISTVHKGKRGLEDQATLGEHFVRNRDQGPVRFRRIEGRGSGETIDRQDLEEAEAAVESGGFDLVVEDLARICRRKRGNDFGEVCEDAGTRLVSSNDAIGTARDDWRLHACFASLKHESGNKDTARRIRRSLRHRFEQGGVVQTLRNGFVKPPGAETDADLSRDAAAELPRDGSRRTDPDPLAPALGATRVVVPIGPDGRGGAR